MEWTDNADGSVDRFTAQYESRASLCYAQASDDLSVVSFTCTDTIVYL